MVELSKIQEKKRSLLQRKAKAEADLARLLKKEKEAARRADNHKKIVYGAVLLSAIEAGDVPAHLMARLVRDHASDRDKELFAETAFEIMESADADVPDTVSRE